MIPALRQKAPFCDRHHSGGRTTVALCFVAELQGMATAEDYDRYASECLRIAASAPDERQRLLMLEMAQAWVRLAALAAKHSREGRTTTG
jgi:hypothetical protein